jgi:Flp pilus assembly protein TadG
MVRKMTFSRFRQRLGDESGMSYVFIGLGLMAFFSASMLAIDVGMLMTARNQAQNSADAGALAGAVALGFDDFDDRSPSGPAVTHAISGAKSNDVMAADVDVDPSDVEFPNDDDGQPTRVKVTVYRTTARGNPLSTLIAGIFGMGTAGVGATATAEASPANAMTCVLPFTIPDRWTEVHTPDFDPDDDFKAFANNGTPLSPPDVYIDPNGINPATNVNVGSENYTGYNARRDRGMQVVLKADNGSKLAPSMYQVWDAEGGDRGSDDVRKWIANCNTDVMGYGQTFVHKPGLQVGPVEQGIAELIAKDPTATWNNTTKTVESPLHKSPRVVAIPLFDPYFYDEGKHNGRTASLKFVNYLGFFIEEMQGNEVVGRITPIGGLLDGGFGDAPPAAFPVAIQLVK